MPDPTFQGNFPALNQPIDELALAEIKGAILAKLRLALGKDAGMATKHDWYKAAALALRDRIVHHWLLAEKQSYDAGRKRVYYLSLEFLIGRLFTDALNNMGLLPVFEAALGDLGVGLSELRKCEPDAALGNGGLGRLAACFMESMATLAIPAIGYGIRYDFGLFRQIIAQGWQHEYPDEWLGFGNPWEFQRPEVVYQVNFGGHVEHFDDKGRDRATWRPSETVQAVAYDTPIVGWRGQHVNALRLWSARSPDPLKLDVFNTGDYIGATAEEARAESICKFLYPNDESPAGRELRLRQEYFFVSASLQDLIKRHLTSDGQLRSLASKAAVQLNDTHPSLAVTELMRILVDLHSFRWDEAWQITVATLSYTNHTLLPEALETWPVELFARLLPRHLEIIYRINVAHLALADARCPGDVDFRASVSLIDERSGRRVRMGQLAFVGSHRINGVSAMHSDLMKETVFHDLNHLYPGRITNKTNGITFRRWLMLANPKLTDLLREACGEAVLDDPSQLELLEARASDSAFQQQFRAVKIHNKIALSRLIGERNNIKVDPGALFDVQIKRIHEYKRQLLNILEAVALYHAIKDEPQKDWVPRVKIFAGKAAASYRYAKLIIKLINDVAEVVNNDPAIAGRLKIVFLADYNVSLAEIIIPAADLSEQISTAGMEASGTGNMKLALNGALTIGTLDGANIEIRDHVGPENIAIFGMEAMDVVVRRKQGLDAGDVISRSPHLSRAISSIESGEFSPDDPGRFASVGHALRHLDHYMVSADFDTYFDAQRGIDARWQVPPAWTRASILNVARMPWFSSDRTIREYAQEIWNVPVRGTLPQALQEQGAQRGGDALTFATAHLFDEATRVTAGDSCWQGRTSDDYWAFVGPFGGVTAATILRALIDHPQRAGDPLTLTVNFCAPIAQGGFDLDIRLVKANRSTQHWCVELSQGGAEVATLATAVFAERRPSWSHQQAEFPQTRPFEQTLPFAKAAAPWVKQYDFRFVEGEPKFRSMPLAAPASAYSKLWIGDRIPRKIDFLSLMSMSDAFFGRVFHARGELMPFGTVSLTTYFHADAEDLAAEDTSRVLAVADAKIFHKSYGDQAGELWSPNGRLLATTTQIAYFKA